MILRAGTEHASAAAALAAALWPESDPCELLRETEEFVQSESDAVFICVDDGVAVGFAHCSLRRDYVEGTNSSPVGYLEGIFVEPAHRRRGIAGELLRECERWAAEKGCREFASDCELANSASLSFHLKRGFREANRIICFTKEL